MRACNRHLRIGLQPKVIIILAVVVVGAVSSGAWFYLTAAESLLDTSDRQYAIRAAQSLGRMAGDNITRDRAVQLRRVVEDFARTGGVAYVAVLDSNGEPIARSSGTGEEATWDGQMLNLPPSLSSTRRYGNMLALAQPIVSYSPEEGPSRLVGSVRLVLDTSQTAARLARARQRMWTIAAAVTISVIPLGYLLAWRIMVQPVRRLASATRRLAGGDFTARVKMRRNDELGELALAFDVMADQIAQARAALLRANRLLEQKVADRTRRLESTNARLQQEITDKDELLRTVSHDLSAPLRNISGMAAMTLLKWREELADDVRRRLERIQANADAEIAMISDLLEVSRIRVSRRERQLVDVRRMLQHLADTFEFELSRRDIALEIAEPMPTLYMESSRINQVFQNLIDNAIKYMDKPRGGRIVVSYRLDGLYHEFRVSDNGPGVPPGQECEVFRIFRRAQSPQSSTVPGKGIGLAVVSAVASGYGGKAWVEQAEGGGASLCFTLALDQTASPRRGGQAAAVRHRGASGRFRSPCPVPVEHALDADNPSGPQADETVDDK